MVSRSADSATAGRRHRRLLARHSPEVQRLLRKGRYRGPIGRAPSAPCRRRGGAPSLRSLSMLELETAGRTPCAQNAATPDRPRDAATRRPVPAALARRRRRSPPRGSAPRAGPAARTSRTVRSRPAAPRGAARPTRAPRRTPAAAPPARAAAGALGRRPAHRVLLGRPHPHRPGPRPPAPRRRRRPRHLPADPGRRGRRLLHRPRARDDHPGGADRGHRRRRACSSAARTCSAWSSPRRWCSWRSPWPTSAWPPRPASTCPRWPRCSSAASRRWASRPARRCCVCLFRLVTRR